MRALRVMGVVLVAAILGGCAVLGAPFCAPNCSTSQHSSSSLVDFLYPNGQLPPREDSVPELHVPLRVGLAFLPGRGGAGPDAALREELLERVRNRFSSRKFVSEIVIIPDYYLGNQRGFAGLEAVQRLYSIDLMALVSYDQVTHRDENDWSLGYLTIVGAYVLKGDRYDVSTLVDLAVVDPATRSLVLRAGGIDNRHGNTTLVDQPRESRAAGDQGFSAAADQMIAHFDTALSEFESQVRAGHANVRVVHRDGTSGGAGAFTWPWLMPLLGLAALRMRRGALSGRCSSGTGPSHPGRLHRA
jgi:rhombotail lipoprotein